MDSRESIEWAPFRLRAGVTEDQLAEASARLQAEFLGGRPGFIARDLVRGPDGGYVDVVRWASHAAAEAAMAAIRESPACAAYFALMDFDPADASAMPAHYALVRRYG